MVVHSLIVRAGKIMFCKWRGKSAFSLAIIPCETSDCWSNLVVQEIVAKDA
jgi:hypothetical protein